VFFLSPLVAGGTAALRVNVQNAPSGAKLDAWIDWNHDGDWNDAGEQIAVSRAVVNGDNVFTIPVPAAASVSASTQTFARFRLSPAGGLATTGLANDGEVEDYAVTLLPGPAHSAFIVRNTNNAGVDSLRQAILDANASPGVDTIIFAIPGGGVHTINL